MGIIRVIQLQFKSGTSQEVVDELCLKIKQMKEGCLDPRSKQPYIKAIEGGPEMSIEGLQHGITHAFLIKFNSVADRDYYAKSDPSHQTVIGALQPVIDKVQIIDLVTSGEI